MSFLDDLFCWSLSAREGAPAPDREAMSLAPEVVSEALKAWRQDQRQGGLFYVGTCHRVELYGYGLDPEQVRLQWENWRQARLGPHAQLRTGISALRHLARVTSSLESEVLGETQITGQIREAAEKARSTGVLSGPLDWCVQHALRVNKKIRSQTSLGEGTVSVAHVAVDGLEDVFDDLSNKNALVIGAGSMAMQALQRLQRRGVTHITWMNRTIERIQGHTLAAHCRIEPFERLHEAVWQHAIIISAVGSSAAILRKADLKTSEKALKARALIQDEPRVILDLGLPRNVDERIHGFNGFYVRNVDEFSNRAKQGSDRRRNTLKWAEELLEDELVSIVKLSEARERGPLLGDLREALEMLKKHELNEMKLENSEDLEYVARAINSKLLHRLIEELDAVGEPLASQILETLVRAWRQPDQWLKRELQTEKVEAAKNPASNNPRAKLVRIR